MSKGLNVSSILNAYVLIFLCWLVVYGVHYFAFAYGTDLFGMYSFRQTQVGSVARALIEQDNILAYEHPVFGPPWLVPMEFPLYQYIVAKISGVFGFDLVETGRILGALSVLIIGFTLYAFGKFLKLPVLLRVSLVAVFGLSPFTIYWSLSLMIEMFTLMLCVVGVYFSIRAIEERKLWFTILAIVFMMLAGLSKITTFLPFVIGLIIYFAIQWSARLIKIGRDEPDNLLQSALSLTGDYAARGFIILLPGSVLALVFVGYSDIIKSLSPMTEFLTSDQLSGFNYGTMEDFWLAMQYLFTGFRNQTSLLDMFFGKAWPAALALGLLGWIPFYRKAGYLVVLILLFLIGPFVFKNLFETHSYYWVANFIFLSSAVAVGFYGIGLLVGEFAERAMKLSAGLIHTGVISAAVVCLLVSSVLTQVTFFKPSHRTDRGALLVGETLQQYTGPDDIILVLGRDWDSGLQFYSDRRFVMVRNLDRDLAPFERLRTFHNIDVSGVVICGLPLRERAGEVLDVVDPQRSVFALRPQNEATGCDVYTSMR